MGTEVGASDPDRNVIDPWAATVNGPILDVGSGTGRWTGHLAALGHDVEGLEPAAQLVDLAKQTHPHVTFHRGTVNQLADTHRRWAGLLAWYTVIHMDPQHLSDALSALGRAMDDVGTLLMSFFSGPKFMPFDHPVTTAYLWPLDEMIKAVDAAGFRVVDQHWDPIAPHAYIMATGTERPSVY